MRQLARFWRLPECEGKAAGPRREKEEEIGEGSARDWGAHGD